MKKALYQKKLKNKNVKCGLCHQDCTIKPGNYGVCLARKNEKGVLYSEVYGKLAAVNVDPIEKKPLYHFYPGSKSFSIGTTGCNFKCKFCQNADISQVKTINYTYITEMTPEQTVQNALDYDCKSISYTYNEPTINYEFALETAKIAKKRGLKNVFVTNGYIRREPLSKIKPYLDAANIDLKSMNEEFYKNVCGAKLDKVLETIKLYHKYKIHTELTTLIITGLNDSKSEITRICNWVINNLGTETPLHFSRFHPSYKMMNTPATRIEKIKLAVETARIKGIKYVYGGNVSNPELNNTHCPKCGTEIINRIGYTTRIKNLEKGHCTKCKEKILLYY